MDIRSDHAATVTTRNVRTFSIDTTHTDFAAVAADCVAFQIDGYEVSVPTEDLQAQAKVRFVAENGSWKVRAVRWFFFTMNVLHMK